jgi:hypothetical protein
VLNKFDLMIGAFWGPRRDSIDTCASVLTRTVAALSEVDPAFRDLWYSRDSPRERVRPFTPDREDVLAALRRGRHRDDMDRSVREDLGFVLSVDQRRNRLAQGRIGLSCGSSSPRLWNSVTVNPPDTMPEGEAGLIWLKRVLTSLITTVEPDWARVDRYVPSSPSHSRSRPSMGWMLYLAVPMERLPPLPEGTALTAVGHGVLIASTSDWFDPENPTHVEAAAEIDRRLDDARLLFGPAGAPKPH